MVAALAAQVTFGGNIELEGFFYKREFADQAKKEQIVRNLSQPFWP